jgi:hypothetical protein
MATILLLIWVMLLMLMVELSDYILDTIQIMDTILRGEN